MMHSRHPHAFTLIEMLVSVTVLTLLLLLLFSALDGLNKVWLFGDRRVESAQNGRTVLELVSREMTAAVIAPNLQFVVNPRLPSVPELAPESISAFWQAPLADTPQGRLALIGYYLTRDPTVKKHQLKRLFIRPDSPTNYQIFNAIPSTTTALWLDSLSTTQFSSASSTLAEGILGFWIESFDGTGSLIPWLSSFDNSSSPLHFNSAAYFQPGTGNLPFQWTIASTLNKGHTLPDSVQITLIVLDKRTLQQIPSIPIPATPTGASDIADVIRNYEQDLLNANIRTARTFTTRVHLRPGATP
jgi:prepilin-type N-terminal cleavage/methylation domain-containing protein